MIWIIRQIFQSAFLILVVYWSIYLARRKPGNLIVYTIIPCLSLSLVALLYLKIGRSDIAYLSQFYDRWDSFAAVLSGSKTDMQDADFMRPMINLVYYGVKLFTHNAYFIFYAYISMIVYAVIYYTYRLSNFFYSSIVGDVTSICLAAWGCVIALSQGLYSSILMVPVYYAIIYYTLTQQKYKSCFAIMIGTLTRPDLVFCAGLFQASQTLIKRKIPNFLAFFSLLLPLVWIGLVKIKYSDFLVPAYPTKIARLYDCDMINCVGEGRYNVAALRDLVFVYLPFLMFYGLAAKLAISKAPQNIILVNVCLLPYLFLSLLVGDMTEPRLFLPVFGALSIYFLSKLPDYHFVISAHKERDL